MTLLSVNVNKIALLRNSRGRDYPNVPDFVSTCLDLGVKGITVHPRPDERHVTRKDVHEISAMLKEVSGVEFNIEGFPSLAFLELVHEVKPDQCTLVPDKPGQLTSDHGWDIVNSAELLLESCNGLRSVGIRSSLFVDPVIEVIDAVPRVNADRIELYTEEFAEHFNTPSENATFEKYHRAAKHATSLGIGINAGHDLDLQNLARFLEIPNILEVSIGHALVVEAINQGLEPVIREFQQIIYFAGKTSD